MFQAWLKLFAYFHPFVAIEDFSFEKHRSLVDTLNIYT